MALSSGDVGRHKSLFEEFTNVLVACAHVPSDESGANAANFIEGIDRAYQLRSRIASLVRVVLCVMCYVLCVSVSVMPDLVSVVFAQYSSRLRHT